METPRVLCRVQRCTSMPTDMAQRSAGQEFSRSESWNPLRKQPKTKYSTTVGRMLALAAEAKEEAPQVFCTRTSSDPLHVPSSRRAAPNFISLSPKAEAHGRTDKMGILSAAVPASPTARSGTKMFIQRDGILTPSTRPRHGGFLNESIHPVLASRYRWRTAAVDCLATHDESPLCRLASAITSLPSSI
ncbi:hypothetical protein T484DRAFT_1899624 [Baffinella frigidus]|nr:hypothetical protein T484DRAFT_1899624 [Cryptophyta sp. CCMP2293]